MTTPSIKTIQAKLKLTPERARTVRKLMTGELDPMAFASVEAWVAQCYNRPRRSEMIMCALNEVLETHGVEAIDGSDWVDSFHGHIRYTYCNTGDAYGATVVLDSKTGNFLVTDWGSLVEAMEQEHAE
jgi:hypothetical protein